MTSPKVLIRCTSPDQVRGPDLERWLEQTIARFEPQMSMCRALAERSSESQRSAPDEQVWFLFIHGENAVDPVRLNELLTEMRLLGLDPTVFHSGRPPLADRTLASFY